MNTYPYIIREDLQPFIFEELKKIHETLKYIEKSLDNRKENKYLEKDDNYYII